MRTTNNLINNKTYLPFDQLQGIDYEAFKNNNKAAWKLRWEKLSLYLKPIHQKDSILNLPESDPTALLEVIRLTKQYKRNAKPAVDDISFKVMPGEFHAFIGANGAGKTTTIKSIVGAYAAYQGKVYIRNHINHSREAKKIIGYIPETARFPDGITTRDYLVGMAKVSGVKKEDAIKFANQTLINLGMEKLAKKSPNTFSSGQKKKVLLAQALVHDPQLLIMDEPAANLDPKARIDFFDSLKELQKQGKSIFISSHILAELDKYATNATILDGGKIVYNGILNTNHLNTPIEFDIICDDNKQLEIILQANNIAYSANDNESGFLAIFKDKKESQRILDLIRNKLEINRFNRYYPSLETIYRKYVKLGSVHTMK